MKAFLLTAADDGINLLFNEFKFNTWEDISPAIGCRTFDVVRLYENGDCAYIDDEGLYQARFFWIHKNYPHPLQTTHSSVAQTRWERLWTSRHRLRS